MRSDRKAFERRKQRRRRIGESGIVLRSENGERVQRREGSNLVSKRQQQQKKCNDAFRRLENRVASSAECADHGCFKATFRPSRCPSSRESPFPYLPNVSTLCWLRVAALLAELEVDGGPGGGAEDVLVSSSCTSNRLRLPRSATDPRCDPPPSDETRALLALRPLLLLVEAPSMLPSSSRSKMPAVLERRDVLRRSDEDACELADSDGLRLPWSSWPSPGAELIEDMFDAGLQG